MSGLTMRELIAYLADQLSTHAPVPLPPDLARAVALADLVTADPDLEDEPLEYDGDDEPTLGWTEGARLGGTLDLEGEHDGREPDADREPWLGWTVSGSLGNTADLELEYDNEPLEAR